MGLLPDDLRRDGTNMTIQVPESYKEEYQTNRIAKKVRMIKNGKRTLYFGKLWIDPLNDQIGYVFEIKYTVAIHLRFRPFYLRIAFPTKRKLIDWYQSPDFDPAVLWMKSFVTIGRV